MIPGQWWATYKPMGSNPAPPPPHVVPFWPLKGLFWGGLQHGMQVGLLQPLCINPDPCPREPPPIVEGSLSTNPAPPPPPMLGAHDALATRRTERGEGQAGGCYVPLSRK